MESEIDPRKILARAKEAVQRAVEAKIALLREWIDEGIRAYYRKNPSKLRRKAA